MKFLILVIVMIMGGGAFASTPSSFELDKKLAAPYQDCATTGANENLIKNAEEMLIQDARIKCQSDVIVTKPFEIVTNECGVSRSDIARVEVKASFSCRNPREKITGVGYTIYQAGTAGPDFYKLADADAVGQCGSNVIRTSEYSFEGEASFKRVYYKYGMVRFITSAQYECARDANLEVRIVHAEGGASHFYDGGDSCGSSSGIESQIDEIAAKNAEKAAQKQCGSVVEQTTAFEYTRSCAVWASIYRSIAKADFKCL
jgi:hypothetical protein